MLEVTGRNKSRNTTGTHSNETGAEKKDRKLELHNLDSVPDDANANNTSSGRGGLLRGRIKNEGTSSKRRLGEGRERPSSNDRCGIRGCKDSEKEDDDTNKNNQASSTDSPSVTEPFPEGKQHCRNRKTYPAARDRIKCRRGESVENSTEQIPEDKLHCKNRTAYPTIRDRQECRVEGLEKRQTGFVTEKYVLAAFLVLSFIGHLFNVCVALCCNGDPADPEEEGYEMADFENDGAAGEEKDKLCS
jgi:hypothetical protein